MLQDATGVLKEVRERIPDRPKNRAVETVVLITKQALVHQASKNEASAGAHRAQKTANDEALEPPKRAPRAQSLNLEII